MILQAWTKFQHHHLWVDSAETFCYKCTIYNTREQGPNKFTRLGTHTYADTLTNGKQIYDCLNK